MILRSTVALTLLIGLSSLVLAADHSGRKKLVDKRGPAGIMGDHIHKKGKWMAEYKYMNMYMEDNRIGTKTISDAAALGPITVDGITTNAGATPTQMTMEMHMIHAMYGATDDITLYTMVMLPSLTMDHIRGPGNPSPLGVGSEFTTHNSGFGDTAFGALLRLFSDSDSDLIFNLGCSVPTGDIFRETSVPTAGAAVPPSALPYPMRLGSGTFNARPGMTYKKYFDCCSFGLQLQTDIPVGRNYRGYSVSDEYRLNYWTSILLTDNWALSLRGENLWKSNFDGFDSASPDLVVSTNVEEFRGGAWFNIGVGTQFMHKSHYFSAEIVPTVYQDVDGIQLETDFSVIGSWSKSW